ncbi:MFS transporter [Eggerthellaceae bacterium zg-893]|nr:MFS transporter [Eggerthellaceae bacterium zg-893]
MFWEGGFVAFRQSRVLVLAAACVCNALVGSLYMWSIFNLPLQAERGWAPGGIALAYSLYLVSECVASIVCGRLQASVSPRARAYFGGLFLSVGWFCGGIAPSLPIMYVTFSLIGGIGSGFLYNTAMTIATDWYPDRRGFATGWCTGCTGLSPLLFAPLGNALIESMGVDWAFKISALLFLAATLGFAWLLRRPPAPGAAASGGGAGSGVADAAASAASQPSAVGRPLDMPPSRMMRTPEFYSLWLVYVVGATSGMMLIGHASGIGQQLVSMTVAQGALMVGVLAVANFAGRLLFGALSDRFGRYPVLAFTLATTAVLMIACFAHATTFPLFTAVLFATGLCFGGIMSIVPALTGDLFGLAHYGQNYALVFSGYTCASLIGPMLGALVLEQTGAYTAAFPIAGALSVAGVGLVVLTRLLAQRRGRAA